MRMRGFTSIAARALSVEGLAALRLASARWVAVLVGLAALTLLVSWPADPVEGALPAVRLVLGEPWGSAARGAVLAMWTGLVLWAGWRLTRPIRPWAGWLARIMLLVLLAGILAPPDLLWSLAVALKALLGLDSGGGEGVDLQVLGHFGLFAILATLLFAHRPDLAWLRLLGLLGALAVTTELMQLFVAGRTTDPWDVLTDLAGVAVGALVAVTSVKLWRAMRRVADRSQPDYPPNRQEG